MSEHGFFGYSGAHLWGNCSQAPHMIAAYPGESNDDAREGTAVHHYLQQVLDRRPEPPQAPNGVIITEEMREAAAVCVRDIQKVCQHYAQFGEIRYASEQHFTSTEIHPLSRGTPDFYMYSPPTQTLIIWEYKHGFSEVSEFENLQLVMQAHGIITGLNLRDTATKLQLRVVQPRCYTWRGAVRSWNVVASDLRAFWNQLKDKADESMSKPTATSGPHCWKHRCPGRHVCPSARNAAANAFEYVRAGTFENLSADALSFELSLLDRAEDAIKARKSGLIQEAESRRKFVESGC